MTKADLVRFLEPFDDDVRILAKDYSEPNVLLRNPKIGYLRKRGVLRLQDGTLLEDGEGYIEVLL